VVLPSGEELAHIRSLHDGMGYFEYKPEEKAGVAKIDYEGSTYQFDLPEALPQGYVLRIDNRRENVGYHCSPQFTGNERHTGCFCIFSGATLQMYDTGL